jgi:hypothetical protein
MVRGKNIPFIVATVVPRHSFAKEIIRHELRQATFKRTASDRFSTQGKDGRDSRLLGEQIAPCTTTSNGSNVPIATKSTSRTRTAILGFIASARTTHPTATPNLVASDIPTAVGTNRKAYTDGKR